MQKDRLRKLLRKRFCLLREWKYKDQNIKYQYQQGLQNWDGKAVMHYFMMVYQMAIMRKKVNLKVYFQTRFVCNFRTIVPIPTAMTGLSHMESLFFIIKLSKIKESLEKQKWSHLKQI